VLVCVEADRPPDREEREFVAGLEDRLGPERVLVVRTKADRADGAVSGFVRVGSGGAADAAGDETPGMAVAAPAGEGLSALRRRMLEAVFAGLAGGEEQPLVTRRRHARALRRSRAAMEHFRDAWKAGHPPEIASTHLQDAVLALEELLGVVTTEDVLDALFASFCVGK
ncbi:MAG TPA: hypothetical protein ENO23_08200, partial [Alphaproteobacteria bacterium]|nr:hypothetical protein [Alphaproteobacteria bacterium]